MKKLLAVFTVLFSLVGLAGCSSEDINAKEEGTNTHAEYVAANIDDEVTIEAYIQGKQGWWEKDGQGVASIYLQDGDGGYFAYNAPCTEDEYNNDLVIGAKVKVTGSRAEWAGEIELMGITKIEVLSGKYIAEAKDVTEIYGNETELVKYQNMKVSVKDFEVVAKDSENVIYYQWNNAGSQGDDIYFDLTDGTNTYTFCIESYLTDKNTDVYKAVEGLKAGDKVDVEGFLYWYEGAQPHVTKITVK